MNCRRIEKLIPLFVEGDLDVGAMNAVSLHLNDCQNCSQIMSQYGESQNWLRTFAPPEFDNAFYVDLKQSVMQEIERKPTRPTLIQRLTERWTWNPTWAMAISMLVLIGALAFYLNSGKTKSDSTDLIITQDKPEQQQHQQEQREEKPSPKTNKDELKNLHLVAHKPRRLQPKREKELKAIPPIIKVEESVNFDQIAESSIDKHSINTWFFEGWTFPVNTTRMEFQTSDPNIRIIWFAPKADHSQSSKTDTD